MGTAPDWHEHAQHRRAEFVLPRLGQDSPLSAMVAGRSASCPHKSAANVFSLADNGRTRAWSEWQLIGQLGRPAV